MMTPIYLSKEGWPPSLSIYLIKRRWSPTYLYRIGWQPTHLLWRNYLSINLPTYLQWNGHTPEYLERDDHLYLFISPIYLSRRGWPPILSIYLSREGWPLIYIFKIWWQPIHLFWRNLSTNLSNYIPIHLYIWLSSVPLVHSVPSEPLVPLVPLVPLRVQLPTNLPIHIQ